MEPMKLLEEIKYPVGEQSFESLREEGFIYVDKTSFIPTIVNGTKYYFLGRPRRFGKSLFLSTLKCFFEGKRHLFTGLAADKINWDWERWPVIHIDFNNEKFNNEKSLDNVLDHILSRYENEYNITPRIKSTSLRFDTLIREMTKKTGKHVVILVDEYDKPLINNINNRRQFDEFRETLAAFYANFKTCADYIRLVFLTGVSRFGQLSVFSGLNNIRDISFSDAFTTICGVTEEELKTVFKVGIAQLAQKMRRTVDDEIAKMKEWYDGYHFSEECPDLYNPFSILNVLAEKRYDNYWVKSGTPTLLVEQLRKEHGDLEQLAQARAGLMTLSGLDIDNISLEALFFQAGYLTIKGYNEKRKIYQLGFPNKEVIEGFYTFVLPYYTSIRHNQEDVFIADLLDEIEGGKVDKFLKRLQAMLADTNYELRLNNENNLQVALYTLFKIIGFTVDVEYHTSTGRIDILIRTNLFVYIIELKYDESAEMALAQIEDREYSLPWAVDSRKIIAIGINYSSKKRCINQWSWKEVK